MPTTGQDCKCICTHIMHTHYSLPCLRPNFQNSQTWRTALDFRTIVVREGGGANLSSLGRMKHSLWIQAIDQ